ncbi:MAG TPA: prolyl oligopeptidase family serine peptidase [Polyangia bacterium]|nr:prolyl oligopeptidase family serine peptidase [Polyangia bacterium]
MAIPAKPVESPAVPTRVEAISETVHGVAVADPYRWLEEADSPEVRRWTEQQNALTRSTLQAIPGRKRLEQRFWDLYEIGSLGAPVPRVSGRGGKKLTRYFYTQRSGKQNQPVLFVRDRRDAPDRALIDVNALAADGTQSLDWWHPSEDGALIAYGISENGSEESVLRVRDVASGDDLPDVIERTRACSLAWLPDGKGFYYTRYPVAGSVPAGEERYHRSVFFHALGTDPASDPKVFGEGRDLKDWPDVTLSPRGRWLVVNVSQGWSRSEIFLIDRRRQRKTPPIPVVQGIPAAFNVVEVLDGRLYVRTNQDAPRGRLVAIDPRHPDRAHWKEILPQGADILDDVAYFGGHLAARYLVDASSRLRLFSADGAPAGMLELPGLGTVSTLSVERNADELFYSYTSFLTPTMVLRFSSKDGAKDVAKGTAAGTVWKKLASPIDAGPFEVQQVRFTSRDGTVCPLFLVHRKDWKRDGHRPTLLNGYGGFNVNILPGWTPSVVPLLEQGGVFAVATLRGGGEYGEDWHKAGMLAKKQNVFDDFIAAAEWLIANQVTSPAELAISGRSNGGLLIGAAVTQRPALFRAAVCGVPLLDMVRYHKFRLAQLWIPEYGSADDSDQFQWLYAYSPYHHVKDGTRYPAVLLHTADSDTRVDPMHARKMTARLQAANAGSFPILLRLESKAGHGAGKPLGLIIAQLVDEWSFLFSQLGLGG